MDPTERFSDRVDDYQRYRPGYPRELLQILRTEAGFDADMVVADIGSGTGLLARLFLEYGNVVYGIEPNAPMRAAGEVELAPFPAFHSLGGRAEATGLDSRSVDLVVAGQAFHWFEPVPTRREFARILKPGRPVVVVWNDRNHHSGFEQEYNQLMLELAPEFGRLRAGRSDAHVVAEFFGTPSVNQATCANEQRLDRQALLGRFLSSSCVDAPRDEVERRCGELFSAHQQDGEVVLTYTTRLHWGVPTRVARRKRAIREFPLSPVSALLGGMLPGLGYAYVGDYRRAYAAFGGLWALWYATAWARSALPHSLAAPVAWTVMAIHLLTAFDSARRARVVGAARVSAKRLYLYMASTVLTLLLAQGWMALAGVEICLLSGGEFPPELATGDRFLVDDLYYRNHQLGVGDLVLLRDPRWVRRVVGLPGDRLAFHDYRLWRNGEEASPLDTAYQDMDEQTVPPDRVYVLGDPTSTSGDSRTLGPFKLSDVKGRAVYVLWGSLARMGNLR